jgi:hypothetical protein
MPRMSAPPVIFASAASSQQSSARLQPAAAQPRRQDAESSASAQFARPLRHAAAGYAVVCFFVLCFRRFAAPPLPEIFRRRDMPPAPEMPAHERRRPLVPAVFHQHARPVPETTPAKHDYAIRSSAAARLSPPLLRRHHGVMSFHRELLRVRMALNAAMPTPTERCSICPRPGHATAAPGMFTNAESHEN